MPEILSSEVISAPFPSVLTSNLQSSLFELCNVTLLVSLLPHQCYPSPEEEITKEIFKILFQFSSILNGIPINFTNFDKKDYKHISGFIAGESPYIHFKINLNVVSLKINHNQELIGKIIKVIN